VAGNDREIRVRVKFGYGLRQITGLREQEIVLPEGSTVGELFGALTNQYGRPFREFIYDERTGEPSTYYQFLIDGKNLNSLDGFDTKLEGGETLEMMILVPGG